MEYEELLVNHLMLLLWMGIK